MHSYFPRCLLKSTGSLDSTEQIIFQSEFQTNIVTICLVILIFYSEKQAMCLSLEMAHTDNGLFNVLLQLTLKVRSAAIAPK